MSADLDKTAELFPKAAEAAVLLMRKFPADRPRQIAACRELQTMALHKGHGPAILAFKMAVELLVGGWVPL